LNKKTIQKLKDLKQQVIQLPDYYYSEQDFQEYNNNNEKESRDAIIKRIEYRVDEKNTLYRKILGFFRANLDKDENEEYFDSLGNITFRPKNGLAFNTFYYQNNEVWKSDKTRLKNLLELLEIELKEKMENKKSTEKIKSDTETNIFSSGLFWTILIAFTGTGYFLGTYKAEYDKSELEKELKIQKKINLELKEKNEDLIYRIKNENSSK